MWTKLDIKWRIQAHSVLFRILVDVASSRIFVRLFVTKLRNNELWQSLSELTFLTDARLHVPEMRPTSSPLRGVLTLIYVIRCYAEHPFCHATWKYCRNKRGSGLPWRLISLEIFISANVNANDLEKTSEHFPVQLKHYELIRQYPHASPLISELIGPRTVQCISISEVLSYEM